MNFIKKDTNNLLYICLVSLFWLSTNCTEQPLVDCNFEPVIKLIKHIDNLFNDCCVELQHNFNETFTTLDEIKNTLTTCCAFAQDEFNGTFTTINEIKNTLTTCCEEASINFQSTWTLLAAEFGNTFTALSEVLITLTTCCNTIENNFQGTFTVIASINSICLFPCGAIPITAPITISVPGSYCLAADGTAPIIINADNVTLDLNNHILVGTGIGSGAGIVVNSGQNRTIHNGRIRNFDTGIVCNNAENTRIDNLEIDTCFTQGIEIASSSATSCTRLALRNITGIGVNFTGINNNGSILKKVSVFNAQQGFVLTSFFNGLLELCQVIDCITAIDLGTPLHGFVINSGDSNQFEYCSVINFTSAHSRGFAFNNAANIIVQNCAIQNLITSPLALEEVVGFDCTLSSSSIQLFNCSLLGVQSSAVCSGYSFDGKDITANNCTAEQCSSLLANEGTGFIITGTNISLTNCQAFNTTNNGFDSQSSNAALIQVCRAEFNTNNGFIIADGTITGNSTAFDNGIGFNAPSTANIYNCFATKNTLNYSITVPNTQNANTQVNKADPGLTGPFAGGNLFM